MNILDAIVEHKTVELLKRKKKRPLSYLFSMPEYGRDTNKIDSTTNYKPPGIIAEFKRKSPSRGTINMGWDPVQVADGYENAGVTAMSILTDRDYFGGSLRDLQLVRRAKPDLPLLRKDFIIDPYQIHEASAYGADIVLLIASILSKSEISDLAVEAGLLGLQVLFEIHDQTELEKYHESIGMVGVNNRNLQTFQVSIKNSLDLKDHLPANVIPVAESGLKGKGEIEMLQKAGYQLFLIGETFMKQADPGMACKTFIQSLYSDA